MDVGSEPVRLFMLKSNFVNFVIISKYSLDIEVVKALLWSCRSLNALNEAIPVGRGPEISDEWALNVSRSVSLLYSSGI